MVWSWFCGNRIGSILTLNHGGIGAVEYMKILHDGLLSMLPELVEQPVHHDIICVADKCNLLFMQDNTPCHKDHRLLGLL